jgi:hypothetical protein
MINNKHQECFKSYIIQYNFTEYVYCFDILISNSEMINSGVSTSNFEPMFTSFVNMNSD